MFQWGHGYSAMDREQQPTVEPQRECSFNGATAIQPWIAGLQLLTLKILQTFQWGHGYSAMDSAPRPKNLGNDLQATVSMGPRLFSHG